jgi:hypothetical protein
MSKMGRPPAQWLLDLPDGEYTVKDLMKISGKTHQGVRWAMFKYAKSKRYEQIRGHLTVYYTWEKFNFKSSGQS